jgi:ubiquinone/menaquinone biosynthesis C-methylase UbiE
MNVGNLNPDKDKKSVIRTEKGSFARCGVNIRSIMKRAVLQPDNSVQFPQTHTGARNVYETVEILEEDREFMAETNKYNICNYSDTDYVSFWKEHNRQYEDKVERMALKRLVSGISGTCLEIGAGYGRLVNEYARFCSDVLLIDYAPNLLDQARIRIGQLGLTNVRCMRANLYDLSLLDKKFDAAVCIRVMHHVENVPDFFKQVNLSLEDNGIFILEYANKKNIVEILRYMFNRPNIKPFDYLPSRRGNGVYYNFNPDYIRDMLNQNGFIIEKEMAVSFFRNEFIKRIINYKILSKIESILQEPLGRFHLSPSVLLKARKVKEKIL